MLTLDSLKVIASEVVSDPGVKVVVCALASLMYEAVGGTEGQYHLLLVLMSIDLLLGTARGLSTEWKWSKWKGTGVKLLFYPFIIIGAMILDIMLESALGEPPSHALWKGAILYLGATEFLSISRHLDFFGVPMPVALLNKVHDLLGRIGTNRADRTDSTDRTTNKDKRG